MRRTPGHNPRGFERGSWNYRCLQLRHALGWTQKRLAKVSGISQTSIIDLEVGNVTRPAIETIRRIKRLETDYADIIEEYKKAPVRMDRLPRKDKRWGAKWKYGVQLLPIEIRRPEDLESLGKVEANSDPIFFGRGSRRRVQQAGVSVRRRARNSRKSKAGLRAIAAKFASGWRPNRSNKQVQPGQSNDEQTGQGGLGAGVYIKAAGTESKKIK